MMKTKYFLVMIMAVSLFSIAAKKMVFADEILGTWKYKISNVPPEYESGVMVFEKKENKTVGYMGQDKQEMQDLMVDQGKVSFSTNFDGGLIKYTLTQKGDSLNGAVATPYGEFPVMAVKDAAK